MPEVVRGGNAQPIVVGRYALFKELAAGGMATVHLGRLLGPVGFSRTIAVKRLHPQFAKDPDFVSMFLDEANLVSRIRHPNVVPTLDVVNSPSGLLLVMEYVHGDSLSRLARKCREAKVAIPVRIIAGIMSNVLLGLHAAHEARGTGGELLNMVHRDVSPQNVLVGADGVARVLDFGVAKAAGRAQTTREGQVKGKLAYMAPEQIRGKVDRRTDVFAAGIVAWELLCGRRMFDGENEGQIISRIIAGNFQPPSALSPDIPPQLAAAVMKALSADPDARFTTAREMAMEIEKAVGVASPSEVGDWVESLSHSELQERALYIENMERASAGLSPTRTDPPPAAPGAPAQSTQSGKFATHAAGAPSYEVEFDGEVSTGARTNNGVFVGEAAPSSSRAWLLAVVMLFLAVSGAAMLAFAIYRMKHANAVDTAPTASASAEQPSTSVVPPSSASSSSSAGSAASALASAAGAASTAPSSSGLAMSAASASAPSASASSVAGTGTAAPASTGWHPPPYVYTAHPATSSPSTTATAPTGAARPKGCDPPYTLDAQGHKHFKPECPLE